MMLNVGDIVWWYGSCGDVEEQTARVMNIITNVSDGDNRGDQVDRIDWDVVDWSVLVDLDIGSEEEFYYATGEQFERIDNDVVVGMI